MFTTPFMMKLLRFATSGGVAAVLSIALLYVFNEWLGIWYLTASVFAFIISVGVHFVLQKLWVFTHKEARSAGVQFAGFISLALINLAINSLCMYICVSLIGINYLVAQVIVRVLLAIVNYIAYERLIFKKTSPV